MPSDKVTIGQLRWRVVIANRTQMAAIDGPGIVEDLFRNQSVRADVQPIGTMTFYAAEQVDTPVTHRIYVRWLDYPDTTHVILRQTKRLDGSVRTETFRIRRVQEIAGRKRFLRFDAELERAE
jgi:head-tail adaptor